MATREQFVAWAQKQLGTVEGGGHDGKSGNIVHYWDDIKHHNLQGQPWCDAFVEAGEESIGVPVVVDSQFCPYVVAAYKKAGRLIDIAHARPGDQVFFHFDGEHPGANHTGILESNDTHSQHVTCIEGNTSPGTSGSQANGGGVYRRTRLWSQVFAIGEPVFDPSTPIITPTANGHPHIGAFATGSFVTLAQTMLINKANQHEVTANGRFDAATVTGTRNFQTIAHLDVTGEWDDKTWSTMLALK